MMISVRKVRPEPGVIIEDIPIPEIFDDEVLVKVKAAGICGSDVHMYEWTSGYEWQEKYMPLVIGHEFSGIVAQKGKNVSNLQEGDRVICSPGVRCGKCHFCQSGKPFMCINVGTKVLGLHKDGAFAEYAAVPAEACYKMPDNVSFEEGASVEPLVVCGNAAYNGNILLGDTVVVMGPGPIGLGTLVFAKAMGATTAIVTGTSKDKARLELAKELGADYIIEVDKEDPVKKVLDITNGYGANAVFEATGISSTIQLGLDMLQKASTLVVIGIHASPAQIDITPFVRTTKRIVGSYGGPVTWERVISWLSAKTVDITKMITDRGSFKDAEELFEKCIRKEAIKAMFIN